MSPKIPETFRFRNYLKIDQIIQSKFCEGFLRFFSCPRKGGVTGNISFSNTLRDPKLPDKPIGSTIGKDFPHLFGVSIGNV